MNHRGDDVWTGGSDRREPPTAGTVVPSAGPSSRGPGQVGGGHQPCRRAHRIRGHLSPGRRSPWHGNLPVAPPRRVTDRRSPGRRRRRRPARAPRWPTPRPRRNLRRPGRAAPIPAAGASGRHRSGSWSAVLGVDLIAVVVGVLLAGAEPVGAGNLRMLGLLALGCAVHVEATRGIEKRREVVSTGRPYIELKSMWSFAGLLLLPIGLALALVAFTFAYGWFRAARPPVPHRWTYSAATVVLGSAAAWFVLGAGPRTSSGSSPARPACSSWSPPG